MKELSKQLEQKESYREALLTYARHFTQRKNKSKQELDLYGRKPLYVIYARKSTEDEKRQVESIEDQIRHCKQFAKQNGLQIVGEIFREEKSAKTAGKRKKFYEMLDEIKKGTNFNSILSWHPDRLARNMKDAGEILDLLDNGIICDLKFPSYTFNNDVAGKMTLSILFAMAKEFSDKLSEDTKRGIQNKVMTGRYVGVSKRGYYVNKDGYYRKDIDTFNIYKQAWSLYLKGKSQVEIRTWLQKEGEDMSSNAVSLFLQDPFYAGIYCYGDMTVDITELDNKFEPMLSARDFLSLQRINREVVRWRKSEEFRPFLDFVTCSECNKFMLPAISKGKLYRYLNLVCTNKACKAKRREQNIIPIANTIRGGEIVDFTILMVESLEKIDKKSYESEKQNFLSNTSGVVSELSIEEKNIKQQIGKLEKRSQNYSQLLSENSDITVTKKISDDLASVLKEIRSYEKSLRKVVKEKTKLNANAVLEFPSYEEFLNFFKSIGKALRNTKDLYLIDRLVRLVFLNLTAKDKSIESYELRKSLREFNKLKILNGVADGI